MIRISEGYLCTSGSRGFYKSLKTGNVSTVVPVSGSYPFITFILSIVLLGEGFSLEKLMGVALVVAGLWVLRIG